ASANEGAVVELTYVVDDGTHRVPGRVTFLVSRFVGALAVAVPDSFDMFEDEGRVRFDVLANDRPGEDGSAPRLVSAVARSGGTAEVEEGQVAFAPAAGVYGPAVVSY